MKAAGIGGPGRGGRRGHPTLVRQDLVEPVDEVITAGRHPCDWIASTISAFNAASSTASPSKESMARTLLLSSRVLNSPAGSFSAAPLGNVSRTARFRTSAMHRLPPCIHTATPSGRD